jgi:UDP-N-acetylmuramoyl-tripeptide--D-alanyl-D-alanine ligase
VNLPLWTWQELAALGQVSIADGPDIQGVCIDSRQVKQGDLFIALSGDPGPKFNASIENPRDGHDFIESAVKGGATAVLLSNPVLSSPELSAGVPYIQVGDTLDWLWALGRAARERCNGKCIAITGSAGKTTARSWLMQCLEEQFQVHGSIGSLNNHWGVPLSLARMHRDTEIGVFEIGTNHPGEISPLSKLVSPSLSVLLNVLPAHIGNFPSMEALEKEKRSIADGLASEGLLVLPIELASNDPRQVTFGLSPEADVAGTYTVAEDGWRVLATIGDDSFAYTLRSSGEHQVLTSLAVLAACYALGADLRAVCNKLAALSSPEGRGNEWRFDGVTVIDDSYNANPVSMQYALDSLREKPGRKIAILGQINELGDEASAYHKEISACFSDFDRVLTVGDAFAATPGNEHYASAADISLARLAADLEPGDTVLIKGSNTIFWKQGFVKALVSVLQAR